LFNSSLKIINKEEIQEKVFNIFEITQKSLLRLYVEQIEEGSTLETNLASVLNKLTKILR
jgi:hypothetical protein